MKKQAYEDEGGIIFSTDIVYAKKYSIQIWLVLFETGHGVEITPPVQSSFLLISSL